MTTIAIVDYGMGNLRSVAHAVMHAAPQANVRITNAPEVVDAADRVILPGQGAMADCMRGLKDSGLEEAVRRAAASRPLLGVCVGEQMLLDYSEEGKTQGLGLIAGRCVRFDSRPASQPGLRLKVPHMGWNRVHPARYGDDQRVHPLFAGIADSSWFYFVHSYYAVVAAPGDAAASCDYGHRFTCAIGRANIFATQFHPEKSSHQGLQLYRNFVSWNP